MRPFSNDLRQRVLEAALRGESTQAQVAQRFSVSFSFAEVGSADGGGLG